MASNLLSERTKTILYWTAIVILFALFVIFLVAYLTKNEGQDQSESVVSQARAPAALPSVEEIRLSTDILPSHYRLTVQSDPNSNGFNGTVSITFLVKDEIEQFKFHAKDLKLESYQFKDANGTTVDVKSHEENDQLELWYFKTEKKITPGNYTLTIVYSGTFKTGKMTGFYKASYMNVDNNVRYMTATKFEPTYARMAFPCFDEPQLKSTFDISVIHPSALFALSNEIEEKTVKLENDWSETTFKRTVPMSTYLVAFAVSDFEYSETKTTYGTRVRVYSRPDQVKKTRYAAKIAAQVLRYFENYTDIPYALSKLDLIAIPEFVSGAIENWGLVGYKETNILSADSDRNVARVISHELSHMWFGNLVTLNWWSDIWLNEGFASYMEFKGLEHVNNSWKPMDTFSTSKLHSAFHTDSQMSAQPIVNSVLTPDQITAMFNMISYRKGASLLYMIEGMIGSEAFQSCIRAYLKSNRFSTVDTSEMIKYFSDEIKKVTKIDGNQYLKKYLYNNSFPILNVLRRSGNELTISQTAYNTNQTVDEPWNIYSVYLLPGNKTGSFVLNQTSQTVKFEQALSSKQWFKLNKGARGYYIVNYGEDWKLLIEQLKQNPSTFSIEDRVNIIFDAILLTDKAMLDYETLFSLFDYLKKEEKFVPWDVATSAIWSIQSKLSATESFSIGQFNAYIRTLIDGIYKSKVEFFADSATMTSEQTSLREKLISLACFYKHKKCLNDAEASFRNWLDNGVNVDPYIRYFVYKYGLQASNNDFDWNRLWDMYLSEHDASEKAALMSTLTSTTSSTQLLTLISYSRNQSIINNENFFDVQMKIAYHSQVGRALIWDYIKNNWQELVDRFGLNDRRLGHYVRIIISGFGTKLRLTEIQNFFDQFPNAGAGETARLSALEAVNRNIKWSQDNEPQISAALKKRDQYTNPWLNWRLDSSVRPVHYNLSLHIDIDKEQFSGSVSIQINVSKPIRHLILHSKDLVITSANLYRNAEKSSIIQGNTTFFEFEPNQFLIIPLQHILPPGEYRAELSYTGKLLYGLTGLYLSKYVDSKTNQMAKLATTQFEAGYTRKAFPCFDEPNFKATFAISVKHDIKYSALSNMPVDHILIDRDHQITFFRKSVPMSTYIVALVVGDVFSKSSSTSPNFSVYSYNRQVNQHKLDYALSVGPKILDYFANDYFKIAYPLPKTDMISIPDFAFGAMENWGLITYRDVILLYDEKKTSSSSKMSTCSIIAHELAHMWFGNLVTMEWWDDLWLNEGFAEFMMYKATAAVEPSWNFMEYFVVNELAGVFAADSSYSTHPILTEVQDVNDMQSIFDAVTYAKGASIIRMLESVIGEENFRQAVTNYLNKHAFKNTVTRDLWSEFSDVLPSHKLNVADIMHTWIHKKGFPSVTVTVGKDGNFSFRQDRFYKYPMDSIHVTNHIWFIPLTYKIIDMKNPEVENVIGRIDVNSKVVNATIADYTDKHLIKFNVNQTGVFVLNYPATQWERFITGLNDNSSILWQKLTALDRNNLLSDAFYLSRSNNLEYDITLRLVTFLRFERSYIVWQTAANMLQFLHKFAIEADQGKAFNYWMRNNVIGTLYDELGFDASPDEDLNRRRLRALILDLSCFAEHEDCLKIANSKFNEFRQNVNNKRLRRQVHNDYSFDPDTFNVILYHTMRTVKGENDSDKFEFLLEQYLSPNLPTGEKMRYLKALTAVQNRALLERLVAKSLNTSFIRAQDYFTFMSLLASNPMGLDIAWKSYQDNYKILQERYGLDSSNLGRVVYDFATYITDKRRKQEIVEFFNNHPEAGASALLRKQTTELIDENLNWHENSYYYFIEHITQKCNSSVCPWNVYRLTDSVVPIAYYPTIQVNTKTNFYNGTVRAEVRISQPTSYIILHAASTLNASNPSVKLLNDSSAFEYSTGKGFRYDPLEFYVIPLREKIPGNNQTYSIEVSFEGKLHTDGTYYGLYQGTYKDGNTTVNLAATQFESTYARRVFPMFDEPRFKQNIHLTVIHEKSMKTTLTNMPIKESVPYDRIQGWMKTTYVQTVKMVTYLIAILVSDFECTYQETPGIGTHGLVNISTCASKLHAQEKHFYSLNVTPGIVSYYEQLTNQPYQLSKLDQIAMPQFGPGAMENWGLIKYREKLLLWHEDEETSSEQRSVAAVIAHELAHMWFGNLVTCHFWGHLWLNEAFASYMEYGAIDYVHPEWNYFDTITYYDYITALLADSKEESDPIVRNVTSSSLMGYSSVIVYNKGSAILHMFNNTMGKNNFRDSLRNYLNKYQYTSVITDQLFSEFAKKWPYEQNVTEFLRSWTFQPGYPYLNITLNATDKTYSYTQERFLHDGRKASKERLYVVPFSYYTMNAKTKRLESSPIQFLSNKSGTLPAEFNNFVKINPRFSSFYLVNYPPEYWQDMSIKLVENTNDLVNALSVSDRSELMISSFYLTRANLVPYLTTFNFYNYLVHEKHFVPWHFYDYSLSLLALRMDRTEYRESLMQFERRITSVHYTGIDFWNDQGTNPEKNFRRSLIRYACRSGIKQCLADARTKFVLWKKSNGDLKYLPPNLRSNILCYSIRTGGHQSDYEFIWQQFAKENDTSPNRAAYLQALSFIPEWPTLKKYIDASLNETVVTRTNFVVFFNYIIQNYAHEAKAWAYFMENHSMLARKLTRLQIDQIVQEFASNAITTARKQEIEAFLSDKPKLGTTHGRATAIATIDHQIKWMNTRKTEVGEWFTRNACGESKTPQPCPWGSIRIDKTAFHPINYNLHIQVNVTTHIYNGTVKVTVQTKKPVDHILLNADSMLAVDLISITGPNDALEMKLKGRMFRYKPLDYLVIAFDETLPVGTYVLTFNFSASLLGGGLSGLYLSNYTSNGKTNGIAVTQFQLNDARKVFPCFDEPAFKSTFDVTIVHDKHMNTTLSNMNILSSRPVEEMPSWTETKFKRSLKMASYLLAMLVSDFVCNGRTDGKVTYRVCASRIQQHKMDYALSIAPKFIRHLENITTIPSPLTKVDLIAIPHFDNGAMENWGIVTFQESFLLYSDADSTSAAKMDVAAIIAHEFAHFWFGNLVTCEWWDNLFLNEAFARYMEYTTVNAAEPSWNYTELFLMNAFELAINSDSGDSVPAIISRFATKPLIEHVSWNIVYQKGASILRMLEFVMKTDRFYKSVSEYLKTNQYNNSRDVDLLSHLDANFRPIDGIENATIFLKQWLNEAGLPYVNITKESDGMYRVRQKRFLVDSSASANLSAVWKIPLSFYNDKHWNASTTRFLTKSEDLFTVPHNDLIKFNPGHYGFYIVNYSPEIWNSWIDALVNRYTQTRLPPVDRAGLLLDSFYLASGNLLSYATPLRLSQYLVNEEHITPWSIAINSLTAIRENVMFGSEYGPQFEKYIQNLVSNIYSRLGWNDSEGNEVIRRLRSNILEFACANNHSDCLEQSVKLFRQWKEGKLSNDISKIPPPNLLPIVLKYGFGMNGTSSDFHFIWSHYLNESSATLKTSYLNALANSPEQNLISMLLNQVLESNVIRPHDVSLVFSAVASSENQESIETLWQFYKTNFVRLSNAGSSLPPAKLSSILKSICSHHFFTASKKAELQSFFAQHPSNVLSKSQQTAALTTIDSNIVWIQNRMSEVENFLLCNAQFCPFTVYRLNQDIVPQRYDLSFAVNLEEDKFAGSAKINTTIEGNSTKQGIRYITLHAATQLNITLSRVVNNENAQQLTVKRAFVYKPYSFWVVELENSVQSSSLELYFEFNSNLSLDMRGFYRSEYYDPESNKTVKLAATQFQDNYARRAFPCFDEPSFRSIFSVQLIYKSQYNATMSNTEVISSRINDTDGTVTTTFADTPKMVTYLLAFVISDFVCGKSQTNTSVFVRVCASPPQKNMIDYALEKSPRIIEVMQTKFGTPYQLSKMDLVAIPDFSAGAMENWGLLTFRETALLWRNETTSAMSKMRVASVVAHEIAHMWFGNLVTCKWWSDLWLNEAFASFMEFFSVAAIEPDWNYHQLFYMLDFIPGLNAAASSTAHPLIRVVNKPSEMPYISGIIYQKGSAVLRMFEFVLTKNRFFAALQKYLKENAFTSLSSSKLIGTLSEIDVNDEFGKLDNTTAFIESWTYQAGLPYISLAYNGANQTSAYTVTQGRFFTNGTSLNNSQTWVIPLSYYTDYINTGEAYQIVYITNKIQNITLEVNGNVIPIKFNKDAQGFFIVNYPIEDWAKWVTIFGMDPELTQLKLTAQDYSQLLFDSFLLSGANMLSGVIPFELAIILRQNEMLSVWHTGATIFRQLWPNFRTNATTGIRAYMQKAYKDYAQYLVRNIYNKYGLQSSEPISLINQRLRSEICAFACAYGLDQCLLEAQVEFKKWRNQNAFISPNIRATVLRYAIQESKDHSDWHYLWQVYTNTTQSSIKMDYLQALAQTSQRELLRLLFDRATDQTLVRRQDYLALFSFTLRTQAGYEVAWDYFTKNYKSILSKRLTTGQVGTLANQFAHYLHSSRQRKDFEKFLLEVNISSTNLKKALESIDKNVNWVNKHRQSVYVWLREKTNKTDVSHAH